MPEIQSLTERVQDLTHAIKFWNIWYIRAVAGTVIFAAGALFAQFMSIRRPDEREPMLAQLDTLKAEQSKRDTEFKIGVEAARIETSAQERIAASRRESDEKIAGLNRDAEKLRLDVETEKRKRADAERSFSQNLSSFGKRVGDRVAPGVIALLWRRCQPFPMGRAAKSFIDRDRRDRSLGAPRQRLPR